MKAMPYKQSSHGDSDRAVTNSYIQEALAKQAAMRPKKSPPKLLPITPTLPKIVKNRKRRRTV